MDRMYYLLNLGISGVKSLKEEVRLQFYKKTLTKDFNPDKYRIKAIYGENGSGKSAIITAVKILKDLTLDARYLNESGNQKFLQEIINKESKKCHIDCEFLMDTQESKIVYYYCIELCQNEEGIFEIPYEVFKVKTGNYANANYKTIFENKNGELIDIRCEKDEERREIEKNTMNLLKSQSFAALCIANSKIKKLLQIDVVLDILMLIAFSLFLKIYIGEDDQHELYFLKKMIYSNNRENGQLELELKDLEKNLNAFCNVNEKRVLKKSFQKYEQRVKRLENFLKLFKHDLVSVEIDSKENGEYYECDLNLNYGTYMVNKEFESTGIKKLIRLFDCLGVVSEGGIAFIDEMDANINDVYLCRMLEYFMYYTNGQLCFTTHNLDPMNVLKENKHSIEFLSSDNHLVSWVSHGNASPENYYKNGMIEDSPFNIDATDFIGIFGE